MTKTKAKPKKPKAPELCFVFMQRVFEELDKAREALRRVYDFTIIKNPAHAIWYRDTLDKVARLEAQVDALAYVYQTPEEDLRKWLDDMLAYYKALENQS